MCVNLFLMICIMSLKLRQYPQNFSIVVCFCGLQRLVHECEFFPSYRKTCVKAHNIKWKKNAAIRWIRANEIRKKNKNKRIAARAAAPAGVKESAREPNKRKTNLNRTDGLHYFRWSLKIYFGIFFLTSDHIIFEISLCFVHRTTAVAL